MTPANWIALAAVVQVPSIAIFAWILNWLSSVSIQGKKAMERADAAWEKARRVEEDRLRDDASFDIRLKRSEEVASTIKELTSAIDFQGRLVATQMENLTERIGEQGVMFREQLVLIRDEQQSIKRTVDNLRPGHAR